MSKLVYPADGLYDTTKTYTIEAKANISNAKRYCSFNIPSSFRYRSYLYNLDDLLTEYEKDMDDILEKAKSVTQAYENLEVDLNSSIKSIDVSTIKRREKIIK